MAYTDWDRITRDLGERNADLNDPGQFRKRKALFNEQVAFPKAEKLNELAIQKARVENEPMQAKVDYLKSQEAFDRAWWLQELQNQPQDRAVNTKEEENRLTRAYLESKGEEGKASLTPDEVKYGKGVMSVGGEGPVESAVATPQSDLGEAFEIPGTRKASSVLPSQRVAVPTSGFTSTESQNPSENEWTILGKWPRLKKAWKAAAPRDPLYGW